MRFHFLSRELHRNPPTYHFYWHSFSRVAASEKEMNNSWTRWTLKFAQNKILVLSQRRFHFHLFPSFTFGFLCFLSFPLRAKLNEFLFSFRGTSCSSWWKTCLEEIRDKHFLGSVCFISCTNVLIWHFDHVFCNIQWNMTKAIGDDSGWKLNAGEAR